MVSLPELGRIHRVQAHPLMTYAARYLARAASARVPFTDAGRLAQMLERMAKHGDAPRWEAALGALPQVPGSPTALFEATIGVTGEVTTELRTTLEAALRELHPWRKGPVSLFGLHVDTEWRSDWKWQRLAAHLPPLAGARVLDVGCGNGYYGWQFLRAGAATVVGVDPTVLFVYQHLALSQYLGVYPGDHWVLPLRGEELGHPATDSTAHFDLVCSMGVLYHRRDPHEHLTQLLAHLRPGGHLVVETLVSEAADLVPAGRYARMRNVHLVPTPATVSRWLEDCGLIHTDPVDLTRTTTAEQRSTDWMTFESLAAALDPQDDARTIEGHPAPVRACFVAELPKTARTGGRAGHRDRTQIPPA